MRFRIHPHHLHFRNSHPHWTPDDSDRQKAYQLLARKGLSPAGCLLQYMTKAGWSPLVYKIPDHLHNSLWGNQQAAEYLKRITL